MVSSKKARREERLKLSLSLPRSTPSLQPTLYIMAFRDCARRSRGISNWTVTDDARTSVRYSKLVDRDEILRVLRGFEAAGLEYVLIGAAAMGFHGLVRAT